MTILLVEDEATIADTLRYALETEGFRVRHVLTGKEGVAVATGEGVDLVVLDIGLPDLLGFDVCRQIRESSMVPILFLTARESEVDQVLGLELGADDYVTKPFSPRAVVARVRAILRRGRAEGEDSERGLIHDEVGMSIRYDGGSLDLTAHEYKIMAVLMSYPGRVYTREQLLERAWDDPGSAMDRTIDAHIKTLRAKLRQCSPQAAEAIQTRRGLGYTFLSK